MIRADRELLARLSRVNSELGATNQNMTGVLLQVLAGEDGGQLNAADLRMVAAGLSKLASDLGNLSADMERRADELERTIDADSSAANGQSARDLPARAEITTRDRETWR